MKTFLNKVKDNKSKILKLLSLLLVVALVSLITLGVLMLTGVLYYEDGFQFNSHIFDAFKGKWYGFIVFILVQSLLSILLCVIPGIAAGFVMFSTVLYENPWQAFLLSYSCVILSSTLLYIIGRLGGYKICEKILGKDDCEKSLNLLRTRGTVYFPLMMLFPIFPDDALVMIAGVTKMKLRWFIPSIILCRGVGVATIIFGMSIIPFDSFVSSSYVAMSGITEAQALEVFAGARMLECAETAFISAPMSEKEMAEKIAALESLGGVCLSRIRLI